MVRQQVDDLFDPVARQHLEPRADRSMRAGTACPRQRLVGDVVQKRVTEAELRLTRQYGCGASDHESLSLQRGEAAGDPLIVEGVLDRRLPERPTGNGGLLQDAPLG